MKNNNESAIKTTLSRIKVLEELYNKEGSNKKELAEKLMKSYKYIIDNTKDEKLTNETLDKMIIIDNFINFRYNSSNEYYNILLNELNNNNNINHKYSKTSIYTYNNDNELCYFNILSNFEAMPLIFKTENIYDYIEKNAGEKDFFVLSEGPEDNIKVMEFNENIDKKITAKRLIFTKENTITYYGGKDFKEITNIMKKIDKFAEKNGMDINIHKLKKRK